MTSIPLLCLGLVLATSSKKGTSVEDLREAMAPTGEVEQWLR